MWLRSSLTLAVLTLPLVAAVSAGEPTCRCIAEDNPPKCWAIVLTSAGCKVGKLRLCYATIAKSGLAKLSAGEFAEARCLLDIGLAINPRNALLFSKRATTHYELLSYEAAISDLRRAVDLEPTNVNHRFNLAVLLSTIGEAEEAVAQYHKMIEIQPDNVAARMNRSGEYLESGDHQRALADFDWLIERHQHVDYVLNNRAMLWAVQGDFAKAHADLDLALKANPKPESMSSRGRVFLMQGNLPEALHWFEKAAAPQSLASTLNLVMIRERLGHWKEAQHQLDNVSAIMATGADKHTMMKWFYRLPVDPPDAETASPSADRAKWVMDKLLACLESQTCRIERSLFE